MELSAYVVEHAVEDDSDAVLVEAVADKAEGVVIAETAVYLLVVNGVVAVLYGLKDRSEVDSIDVHLLEVWDPVEHLVETE